MFGFLRTKKMKQRESITQGQLESIISGLTHEMRTSLVAIETGISCVKDHLPIFIEAYEKACSHALIKDRVNQKRLDMLSRSLDNAQRESYFINYFINSLALNFREISVESSSKNILSIKHCVKCALDKFPYRSDSQKDLLSLSLNFEDFKIWGNRAFIEHMLSSVLRHSVKHVEEKGSGEITIDTDQLDGFNVLTVRDTGCRVSNENLTHIFCKFSSSYKNELDMGLHFCKMVMKKIGGSISCFSEEGAYTEFKLCFPFVTQKS